MDSYSSFLPLKIDPKVLAKMGCLLLLLLLLFFSSSDIQDLKTLS